MVCWLIAPVDPPLGRRLIWAKADAELGITSEIFEAEPPHRPSGAPSQA
jgi:hypothetical protein